MQLRHAPVLRYLTLLIITFAVASGNAIAQSKFPSKPIRLLVASSAASQPDTIARMIGQKMTETWGFPWWSTTVAGRPA